MPLRINARVAQDAPHRVDASVSGPPPTTHAAIHLKFQKSIVLIYPKPSFYSKHQESTNPIRSAGLIHQPLPRSKTRTNFFTISTPSMPIEQSPISVVKWLPSRLNPALPDFYSPASIMIAWQKLPSSPLWFKVRAFLQKANKLPVAKILSYPTIPPTSLVNTAHFNLPMR